MRIADMHGQLKQRPFVPLRTCLSDGSAKGIRHPEMVAVSRTVISLAEYRRDDDPLPERFIWCDPLRAVRLEPIDGKDAQPPDSCLR